jgi:hypothetical protein
MKNFRVLMAFALVLSFLTGAVACSFLTAPPSEELETKIYTYLENKYPGMEFEIKSYTQDTYTSGKYVFNVFCKTTEIDFLVYQSSFLTTDSYTVTYANLSMEEMLVGILGETLMSTHVKAFQWLDAYADGNTGYKFREVDLTKLPESALEIKSIYKIMLNSQDTESAVRSLKAVMEQLTVSGIECDKITFEWFQDDYNIVFTTDTNTLTTATDEQLGTFLKYVSSAKQSDEIVKISYVSRMKSAELFLDEIDEDAKIPGFFEPEEKVDDKTNDKTNKDPKETTP